MLRNSPLLTRLRRLAGMLALAAVIGQSVPLAATAQVVTDGTLTINLAVTNDSGTGDLDTSDIPLLIDGVVLPAPAPGSQASAIVTPVTAGDHLIEIVPFLYYNYNIGLSGTCGSPNVNPVTVPAGENVTCNITFDDLDPAAQNTANLSVLAHVVNDDGGTATADDFTLRLKSTSFSFAEAVVPGILPLPLINPSVSGDTATYAVSGQQGSVILVADAFPGYTASAFSGDCAADGNLTLLADTDRLCEITFDDITPTTLTINLEVRNDDGTGDLDTSDIPLLIDGVVLPAPAPGSQASAIVTEVTPGDHLIELVPFLYYNYDISLSGSCGSPNVSPVNVPANTNVICNIVFHDAPLDAANRSSLTVLAHVVNDGGGTATADEFTIRLKSSSFSFAEALVPGILPLPLINPSVSGDTATYVAAPPGGTVFLVADAFPGYTASAFSGDCAADGFITFAVGEQLTCEITFDDLGSGQPSLSLEKEGSYDAANGQLEFTLSWSVEGTGTVDSLTVSDPLPAGLTFVSADNGGALNGGNVEWSLGSQTAPASGTVSFIATLDAASSLDPFASSVIATNQGTQNNGSALPADRSDASDALGAPQSAGAQFDPSNLSGTFFALGLNPQGDGGSLTLGFSSVIVNGAGNDLRVFETTFGPSFPEETARVEVSLDGTSFTPVGTVTRDGEIDLGSVGAARFVRLVDISNPALFNENGDGYDVDAVQALNTAPDVCEVKNSATAAGLFGQAQLSAEAAATVTVTEAACEPVDPPPAQTGTVRVIKEVINDNGGTAVASDFTLFIEFAIEFGGDVTQFAGSEAGTVITVPAGTEFRAGEVNAPGYSRSFAGSGCTGTMTAGAELECVITNNDIPGGLSTTLTVVKNVINDNGGAATTADFQLFLDGNEIANSGAALSTVTHVIDVSAGDHTVSEPASALYRGTFSGDCDADGNVFVPQGTTDVTCVLTNNDIGPNERLVGTLIVTKNVVNDNGGDADAVDFPLFLSGLPLSTAGAAGSTITHELTVNPGTYQVSETASAAYQGAFSGDCDADGNVTIAAGETKTCVLTNDDIAPKITVIKTVINDDGGTLQPNNFSLQIFTAGTDNPLSAPFDGSSVGSDVFIGINRIFEVRELNPEGYSQTFSAGCSGSTALGTVHVCEIVNDDIDQNGGPGGGDPQTGTLVVTKQLINQRGDDLQAVDFQISVDGSFLTETQLLPGATDGIASYQITLPAGSHTVAETPLADYVVDFEESCDDDGIVTVIAGQTVTCRLINFVPTTLHIIKRVINNDGGTAEARDFEIFIDDISLFDPENMPAGPEVTYTGDVRPQTWTISEAPDERYVGTFSGDCSAEGEVTIATGDTKTCILTNDDVPQDNGGSGGSGGSGGNSDDDDVTIVPPGGTAGGDIIGGSSSSGGSSSGGSSGSTPPPGQVAGDTDADDDGCDTGALTTAAVTDCPPTTGGTAGTPPPGQVAGATDELPRTGLPAGSALLLGSLAYFLIPNRKRQAK